jgi:type IV secretion system protein VirB3
MEGKTIGGVDSRFVILNGTMAAAIVMGMNFYYWIPIAFGIHLVLRHLYAIDPKIREVYMRYAREADIYDPWPRHKARQNERPKGWGRGMLC